MAARGDAETLRAETQRAAADRALRARQQQQTNTAGVAAGRVTANEALLLAGPSPDTGHPYTEEEWELRERLRHKFDKVQYRVTNWAEYNEGLRQRGRPDDLGQ